MEKKYLSRENIVGKQVIDSNAIIVGNVKDMSFDITSRNIALEVTTKAGTNIVVDGDNISIVADVVLLNKPVQLPVSPVEKVSVPEKPQVISQPVIQGLCSACGYQNDPNSKFCIKCGKKL